MLGYGVMLSIDGPEHNVLKIKPPLVVDRADADFFLEKLDRVLERSE
jgi:4-aminobutyrate aminotransferase-like enzyme